MKYLTGIAVLFYLPGLLKIIDWFIFWHNNEAIALSNRQAFMQLYVQRFPGPLQLLFRGRPEPATLISIFLFLFSGIVFYKTPGKWMKALAISAFVFACWNIFSLM
jgi:hypothetical protein